MESRVQHSVRDVQLRIVADSRAEGLDLQDRSERFVRRVLEYLAEEVERRAPGRVVFIRKLSLRVKLDAEVLGEEVAVRRCAEDVLRALDLTAEPALVPVDPGGEGVVFAGEAERRASCLWARAQGGGGEYFFRDLSSERTAVQLIEPMPRAILASLERAQVIEPVLRGLEATELEAVARMVGIELPRAVEPAALKSLLPAVIASFVRAANDREPVIKDSVLQDSVVEGRTIEAIPTPVIAAAPAGARRIEEERVLLRAEPPLVQTAWGGLFFLLNPALELSAGELLWRACLSEKPLFGHAFASLLGEEAAQDPALALLGAEPKPPPAIAAEQRRELTAALFQEWLRAIPRRGLAELPPLSATLAGRLLVVTPRSSPFAVFAAPAAEVEDAIRSLLSAWPRSAPPIHGDPVLAELAGTPRLRARPRREAPPAPLLPSAESLETTAVLAVLAGAICALAAARAGHGESRETFAKNILERPAAISTIDDRLAIHFPKESVDLDLRRAGLDRDPGWVPWLGKTVRFEIEAEEL